jgi:hypothetical protein
MQFSSERLLIMRKYLQVQNFLILSTFFIVCHDSFAQLPPLMKHRVIIADEGNGKVHYINLANPTEKWSITTANRDLQLIGNNRLMVSVGDGYAEYNVNTGAFINKITTGGTVQSVFRLTPKSTYVGADGNPATLTEVDSTGKQIRKITFALNASIRVVRPTSAKTFLVGGKVAGTMYECDSTGKIVLEIKAGGEPYMGLRLPNGNTLISTGYGDLIGSQKVPQMVLVDSKANVLKKFPTQTDLGSDFWKQASPYFFGGFQILKNGNIVVSNWEGHGPGNGSKGFQLIEIDSSLTKVVSYWKQDPNLVSSIHGVLVTDSLDTEKMYSDVNGILAPVEPPSVIEYGSKLIHSGSLSPNSSAYPTGILSHMFSLSGRSIAEVSSHYANGIYVLKKGVIKEFKISNVK